MEDNRVKHLEQEHQTVDYEYDDLGRVIQKRIQIKDRNAFGHIQQNLSTNHLLNQFSTRQIDLDWDEQNQLSASTSTKPDGRGGQEIIETQYCYDPFVRRIAKQSQIYKKELVTQLVKLKTQPKIVEDRPIQNNLGASNQLGSSMNLSLGGNSSQPSALSRAIAQPKTKMVNTEQVKLIQKQAVWNVWDGNRILQDYNGKHVFTTVYEADAFVPLARLVWLEDKLTEAANDDTVPKVDIVKLEQLKQVALQNIGELEGLDDSQTIPAVANDEPPKHSKHQVYWYQNDHLGTPIELTSSSGNIEWEAVYQAWGNTVTVEWQEVAQTQELNSIQMNAVEQSYLLQPHRFQGQIYDVETGLHYNRFRYYDPDAGRFISHDPIGLDGGNNHFQYAPNPVEWIDPLGLIKGPCDCLKKGNPNGKGPFRGGSYGGTTKSGIESHHMPADSVNGMRKSQGPAIQMDPADHRLTSSHGHQGNNGKVYRAQIQALINQGNWRKALAIEILDVRRVARLAGDPTKYNQAILEMIAYSKCLGKI